MPMGARIASIESFRVLSIIGVIIWHTDFLATLQKLGRGHVLVDVSLYLVWWVTLPYVLITAGGVKRFSLSREFPKALKKHGEPAGARTRDPRLKRAMLYQLSYRLTGKKADSITDPRSVPRWEMTRLPRAWAGLEWIPKNNGFPALRTG